MDDRVDINNDRFYYIKWLGYDENEATWENGKDIESQLPEMVE